jgi:pimeloyl-ACP methyl ester carboxylesterase
MPRREIVLVRPHSSRFRKEVPMPVIQTPAGPVETIEWGEGDEVVVLVHAAAAGPGALSGLARALSRPGRRIIAPALNGYAGTSLHFHGDRVVSHAAAIDAVLAAQPVDVLFGHSMGGLAALLCEPRYRSLVLYEPIVTAVLREDDAEDRAARDWDRAINAAFEHRLSAGDPEGAIATFVEAWNETPWSGLPEGARARLIAAAPSLGNDMHAVSFFAAPSFADRKDVLILQGTRSPPITARMTARLAAIIPGARRRMVEGAGHMGPVLAPALISAAILSGTPSQTLEP